MKDLAAMSILITGGSSGIGAGAARYFAQRGARVTISARREDRLNEVRRQIGERAHAVVGDVTVDADRKRMIDEAVAHGAGLDALINNAGNMYRGEITELEEQPLLDIFNSNVVSGMLLSGLATPELARRNGAIIFLGSIHTRRAFPGASPYAATKGALEALTGVMAAELGEKGIRVNCVVPGAVPTEMYQRAGLLSDEDARARIEGMATMHPLGRIGTEEEIAEAMAYLIQAEWTTGAVLVVDGGLGLGSTSA
ncbi:MAG: SDR family oxidoreductase [Pseudomonadales bacterium]|jgi:3-oxoacyl-[acyl-carrier protein] reductase